MMYHVKIDEKKKQILICRKDDTIFHIIMDVDVSKIKKSILKKEYDKKNILDLIKKIKKQW